LFSEAQYRRGPSATRGRDGAACGDDAACDHEVTSTPPPFDPSAKIEWSPVWSLRDGRFRYLPTSLLYFFHHGGSEAGHIDADSNGCAAGNTLEEAIVQGFLELVERDSYAIWWYNRARRPEVDLDAFDDSYVRDLKLQLGATGRRLWVLDITTDLGIPSFVAMSHALEDGQDFVEYGSGSHFDARIAMLRALTELNQFLSIGLMGARNPEVSSDGRPFRLQEHPYLLPSGEAPVRPDFGVKFGGLDKREQAMACVDIAKRQGMDFLVLDQTRPDIEVPVARVIVPGLRHFYRRFAPGRLYDVPVKLGWRDRLTAEHELNPLHPHT
jgi:oxazoline/thiazoline synthase